MGSDTSVSFKRLLLVPESAAAAKGHSAATPSSQAVACIERGQPPPPPPEQKTREAGEEADSFLKVLTSRKTANANRAIELYKWLKDQSPRVLAWNGNSGEIRVNNSAVITGSNIIDLVTHAVNRATRTLPIGWSEFLQALQRLHPPAQLLAAKTLAGLGLPARKTARKPVKMPPPPLPPQKRGRSAPPHLQSKRRRQLEPLPSL